jgi:hypothetical protein
VTDCIEAGLVTRTRRPPEVSRIQTCDRLRFGAGPRPYSKSDFCVVSSLGVEHKTVLGLGVEPRPLHKKIA